MIEKAIENAKKTLPLDYILIVCVEASEVSVSLETPNGDMIAVEAYDMDLAQQINRAVGMAVEEDNAN